MVGTFGVILLLFAGGAGGMVWLGTKYVIGHAPYSGPTFTVRKEKLKIAIVARGSLESAKNGDVVCTVRSGTKGSTVATTIKWLVDNGADVAKDEKIMELDSSGFIEQLKDQNIKVEQAKSLMIQAEEAYGIQELDNQTDIEKAQNTLELAKIDLDKYIKGDYEQAIKDVEGRLTTAQSDYEDWKDRSAWSKRMTKKGLMSQVQADADASRMQASGIAVQKLEEERRVLTDYTKKRTIQDLTAKLAEAKRGVEKAKGQARAKLAQAEATKLEKKSVYDQEVIRKKEIEGEIAKCKVVAPQDGIVVYYVPEQVKGGGGGAQQSVVAQGEPVREGQKMMQIPDLSQMLVNVKVPEAFVSHLHSADPDDPKGRQHATIRVDAFSKRTLKGHVKTVATVASQADWFASDVRSYQTMVTIAEVPSDIVLRPGMNAEVTILADESTEPVLVVPVQAVIGTISMNEKRKCFVIGADGQPVQRDIIIGMSNERLAAVNAWDDEKQTGLKEGEKVVEDPRPLLSEDSEMRPGRVRAKADDGDHGGGDNGGGKKGKGKKKGPGGPGGPEGPGGPGGATKGIGGAPSPEQMQQMKQMILEKARNATPAQRKEMLEKTPEQFRSQLQQLMRENNLEIGK